MKRNYYGIRKVNWDSMWHAMFKNKDGLESWDRVTHTEAMAILPTVGPFTDTVGSYHQPKPILVVTQP